MASPDEHTLTFLRGSGFLLSLVGVWDLMADESNPWPSQKGVLIFKETKITAVIERNEERRRGIEGTYTPPLLYQPPLQRRRLPIPHDAPAPPSGGLDGLRQAAAAS